MYPYEEVAKAIHHANKIVVLTGAGISTASGIPDFRSNHGLYQNRLNIEDILSEHQFRNDPAQFWKYFKDIFDIKLSRQYEPNFGHNYLRELERLGKEVTVLTQNVDGLHRKAGSTQVYELHGTIEKAYCPSCKQQYGFASIVEEALPTCPNDSTVLKPDVVLFGGVVKHMDAAYERTANSDLFVTIGTSLHVYPVREIPGYIRNARGISKVIINLERTNSDGLFDYVIHDDINTALKQIRAAYEQIQ